MKPDNLSRFVELRNALMRERRELEQRLRRINEALGEGVSASGARAAAMVSAQPVRRGRPAGGGGLSLRETVLKLTAQRPMTKEEILKEVQVLGYKFATSNPLNSLGVVLYGKNPRFKNEGGFFSPGTGSGPAQNGGNKAGAFPARAR